MTVEIMDEKKKTASEEAAEKKNDAALNDAIKSWKRKHHAFGRSSCSRY